MSLTKVTELPDVQSAVRERWSDAIIKELRANPGDAFKIFDGPTKLMRSRAGYLRQTCPDIDVRLVVSAEDDETATVYASADGSVTPDAATEKPKAEKASKAKK